MRKSLILLLILLTLSCNFPGSSAIISGKEITEPTTEVSPGTEDPKIDEPEQDGDVDPDPKVDEPEQDADADPDPKIDEPEQDDDEDPDDVDTGSPTNTPKATSTDAAPDVADPTATHTPTLTPTATNTPTITPTATKGASATQSMTPTATPTNTPKVGAPMSFEDPSWELVEWHRLGDTGEWEGTLRARVTGGTPPYRSQFEDNDIVDGLDIPVRWRLCKPMPATIRVLSADGQDIHIGVWVYAVGCQ